MADYRIIDADGHVMELDSRAAGIHRRALQRFGVASQLFLLAGLTMDGFLRSLRKKGGWAGGGTGPNAQGLAALPRHQQDRADGSLSDAGTNPRRDPGSRLGDLHGQGVQRLALQ